MQQGLSVTTTMDELNALPKNAQSGDLDATGELLERFQDMATGYAYALLGDSHLAEDAVQAAYLEACLHLARVYSADLSRLVAPPGLQTVRPHPAQAQADGGPRRGNHARQRQRRRDGAGITRADPKRAPGTRHTARSRTLGNCAALLP